MGLLLKDRELVAAANANSPMLEARLRFALRRDRQLTAVQTERLVALLRRYYRLPEA